MCVLCWSAEDPGALGSIRAWAVFENRSQSQKVCRCGTEAVGSRSPLFLSIQGHCWGLKINCGLRPVCEAQWPHGPWKTCRASLQEMYKLTRWVYLVYFHICWFNLDNLLWLSKVVVLTVLCENAVVHLKIMIPHLSISYTSQHALCRVTKARAPDWFIGDGPHHFTCHISTLDRIHSASR